MVDACITGHSEGSPTEFFRVMWGISGGATAITVMISFVLIFMHLKNYTRPEQQRYIVRILLMVPIYSSNSWLSLRFYWLAAYFDVVRDCYEAYVILSFYYLLIELVGGYEHCKDVLETQPSFRLIPPFCCFRVHPRRGFLRASMRLLLQYVFIRPAVTFSVVVLSLLGKYCAGNFSPSYGYIYLTILTSISVANVLIIFEMMMVAIFHLYAFPYQDYAKGGVRISMKDSIYDVINPGDILAHSIQSFVIRKKKGVAMKGFNDDEDSADESEMENDSNVAPLLSNYTESNLEEREQEERKAPSAPPPPSNV